jgi:hypothetical protein
MTGVVRCAALALLGVLAVTSSAAGAEPTIASLLRQLDKVESFAAGARSGDPESVGEGYEEARELQEMLAGRTAPGTCATLVKAIGRAAAGHVLATEGFDRIDDSITRRGESEVASAMKQIATARKRCAGTTRLLKTSTSERLSLLAPLSGEAFFGKVQARCVCSSGPASIEIRWNGRLIERSSVTTPAPLVARSLARRIPPGRGDLELRIVDAEKRSTTAVAEDVWLLAESANTATGRERRDGRLSRRLATIAAGFSGYAGISIYELGSGRTGGWNEDARFPAASLVKLGVLVAALDHFGPTPERSRAAYDIAAMAAWSSNLGANRLLELLGNGNSDRGRRIVEARLRRMGAMRSTYPGDYRVGTSVSSFVDAPHEPPLVSQRTTTSRDMARVLSVIHSAATGDAGARRSSGLSSHEAKVALRYLLSSEPRGDNIGLFRPWLPKAIPVAQKHGWISDARHSAAIVYRDDGPVVVVVLTYRDGLSLSRARVLGRRVLDAAELR